MRAISAILFLIITLLLIRACGDSSDHSYHDVQESPPSLGVEVALRTVIIRGREHGDSEVWEWLAIPYAQPPTGELRWRTPRPVESWEGVREATTFGEPCPQFSGESVIGDEDCLHLNIWRPRTQERGLPVYVWIHGGSNVRGSNSWRAYQLDRIAQNSNVIAISIQYRLGPLGWLFYDPLHTGQPLEDSGSFGLLDIILSLEWIQNNIESFGGDKGNVTLDGQSSGAENILSLLLSEQASGLFHKVILQSHYPQYPSIDQGRGWSASLYDNLTALTGISLVEPTSEELALFMRERSAAELVEGYSGIIPSAFTDGTLIPEEGAALFVTGSHVNKVPMIIGTTRDEYKYYTAILNDHPDVNKEVREGIGRYGSDIMRARSVDQFANGIRKAPEQPEVYLYRFNWGSPDAAGNSPLPLGLGTTLGAHHGVDIPFVLGHWEEAGANPEFSSFKEFIVTEENISGRQNLSDAITRYFASFAYSGNPNGHNQPVWEPFTDEGDFKAIQFDVNVIDNSPKITPDFEVFTVESVLDDLEANLEEPARSQVLDALREVGFLE